MRTLWIANGGPERAEKNKKKETEFGGERGEIVQMQT